MGMGTALQNGANLDFLSKTIEKRPDEKSHQKWSSRAGDAELTFSFLSGWLDVDAVE